MANMVWSDPSLILSSEYVPNIIMVSPSTKTIKTYIISYSLSLMVYRLVVVAGDDVLWGSDGLVGEFMIIISIKLNSN